MPLAPPEAPEPIRAITQLVVVERRQAVSYYSAPALAEKPRQRNTPAINGEAGWWAKPRGCTQGVTESDCGETGAAARDSWPQLRDDASRREALDREARQFSSPRTRGMCRSRSSIIWAITPHEIRTLSFVVILGSFTHAASISGESTITLVGLTRSATNPLIPDGAVGTNDSLSTGVRTVLEMALVQIDSKSRHALFWRADFRPEAPRSRPRCSFALNAETSQSELPLPDAVQQLDAGDRDCRICEPLKAEHHRDALLHAPMVLLYQGIQVFR